MSDIYRKFPYKYRLLCLAIGVCTILMTLWIGVDRILVNRMEIHSIAREWAIVVFGIIQAIFFISTAIGTYILATQDGIVIKFPFHKKISSSWENIERVGAVEVPKSIYTEMGIRFKEPPYRRQTVWQKLSLQPLLDGKTLLLCDYLKDNDAKELENMAIIHMRAKRTVAVGRKTS